MSEGIHDLFVIGGGINGCGIARDAAGRGYSVFLAEMNDLASGTSSASTKLIHGGLRYLEFYEFRLVREALMEREILWRNAPHIIRPLRFVLPFARGIRPAWMIRLGLFLYDHIGGRKLLPPTRSLDMRADPASRPLKPLFSKAFEYSDCAVDDSRLVVLNARDAADRGATIRTRAKVVGVVRQAEHWEVSVRDLASGQVETVRARLLVNAGGPWVDRVLTETLAEPPLHHVRLVQGSHIVVRRKYEDPRAYFFQNRDGRIIFAIPYQGAFTLIGTTDRDYVGDPGAATISEAEIDYLCRTASEYFAEPVTRQDIVWTFSGVRPLYDDGASKAQEATREYVIKADAPDGAAPIVNIFGGKITTYRRLAEAVLDKVGGLIGKKGNSWTAGAALPGGDFPVGAVEEQAAGLRREYPFLSPAHAKRLVGSYGTAAAAVLGGARASAELGRCFGADLYETEVRYLREREWAVTADDILWRRSKLGLWLTSEEAAGLAAWLRSGEKGAAAAE